MVQVLPGGDVGFERHSLDGWYDADEHDEENARMKSNQDEEQRQRELLQLGHD
jgi:hypothetical protein